MRGAQATRQGVHSINPKNNKLLKTFSWNKDVDIKQRIDRCSQRFVFNQSFTVEHLPDRHLKLKRLQNILKRDKDKLANIIVTETGKPIAQAGKEVERAIGHIEYYVEKSPEFLATEAITTLNGQRGEIFVQPLGPTLVILPFNFPIWMPFKSALGALMIGNPIIMKHSCQVPQCAIALENAFLEADFDQSEFTNIFATHDQVRQIIADNRIQAVKFTGGTPGGMEIASQAGFYMKKGTYELAGNDPFLVLESADLEHAARCAYESRMHMNAQTGFNAKRFIIEECVYDEFRDRLLEIVKEKTVIGDPMDPATTLGPMCDADQLKELKNNVRRAIQLDGGRIIMGDLDYRIDDPALRDGNFLKPIVTEGILPHTESFATEFYGPVFNLFQAETGKECLDLANASRYGLAATIFTKDLALAENYSKKLRVGSVAINEAIHSYSDLPSGGIKNSGYGREGYKDGLLEIAYKKSIIGKNY